MCNGEKEGDEEVSLILRLVIFLSVIEVFYSKREVSDPTIKSNLKNSSSFFDLDCVLSFSIICVFLFSTKWAIFMKYINFYLIRCWLNSSCVIQSGLYKTKYFIIINQVIQLTIIKIIMNNVTKIWWYRVELWFKHKATLF